MNDIREELEVVQQVYQLIVNFMVTYSFQIAGAVIILIAGVIVGRSVANMLLRVMERRNVDVTLRQFIASTVRLAVLALFVIIALSKLGISITPLIAAIGGLAVGVSLALQAPVSNYGAGLVIILTRMFKVGDTITVQGCSGEVTHIDLAQTRLIAEDGEDIVIPNKHIVGEIHRNSYGHRLVEASIGIDGRADPADAARLIGEAIDTVVPAPDGAAPPAPPVVGISGFDGSAIVVGYRYWVPTRRYFELQYAVNDAVHARMTAAGIGLAVQRHAVEMSPAS